MTITTSCTHQMEGEHRWLRPPAGVTRPRWQRDPVLSRRGCVWSPASASRLLQTAHGTDGMQPDWMDAWQPGSALVSATGSWRRCQSQRLCPCFHCWVWGKAVRQMWCRCLLCAPLCVLRGVYLGHLFFGPPSVSQPIRWGQSGSPFQSRLVLVAFADFPSV